MNTSRYVIYYRVSTSKQHHSGLGLAAQRQAVTAFLNRYGGEILAEYTEIESGRKSDRPALAQAADYALLTNASLLVAKLDRLSRDLHFITGLQKKGIAFRLCDFPEVNPLTLHILAAVAEHEAHMIASRTKAALTQAKLQGKVLGNPQLDKIRNQSLAQANQARQSKTLTYENRLLTVINHLDPDHCLSPAMIAHQLNQQGFTSYRGKAISRQLIAKLRNQQNT